MWIVSLYQAGVRFNCYVDAFTQEEAEREALGQYGNATVESAVKEELEPGSYYHRFI